MYPRVEYEMPEDDLEELLDSCKPVPYLVVGGIAPRSQQENANRAWQKLGEKMGFDWETVRPVEGKGHKFFTAIPTETESQRKEREEKEAEAKRQSEITQLEYDIKIKQKRLKQLRREK